MKNKQGLPLLILIGLRNTKPPTPLFVGAAGDFCYNHTMHVMEITKKITPILEKYEVSYAGVFGSVARGDDRPESDVDIVVSTTKPVGIYTFMALKDELSQVIGRDVDLVSKNAINKYLEPYINEDLITVYEKR